MIIEKTNLLLGHSKNTCAHAHTRRHKHENIWLTILSHFVLLVVKVYQGSIVFAHVQITFNFRILHGSTRTRILDQKYYDAGNSPPSNNQNLFEYSDKCTNMN